MSTASIVDSIKGSNRSQQPVETGTQHAQHTPTHRQAGQNKTLREAQPSQNQQRRSPTTSIEPLKQTIANSMPHMRGNVPDANRSAHAHHTDSGMEEVETSLQEHTPIQGTNSARSNGTNVKTAAISRIRDRAARLMDKQKSKGSRR